MNARSWWVVGVLAWLVPACGHPGEPAAAADTLVLELGGDNRPLSESLARLGIAPAAPPSPPSADPTPAPPPAPVPPPAVEPEVLEVPLQKGQTLSELAREHLGSAQRWREIADFNGWDEAHLRRLQEGTVVRIPRPRAR